MQELLFLVLYSLGTVDHTVEIRAANLTVM